MDTIPRPPQNEIACKSHSSFQEELVMRKFILVSVAMLCFAGAAAAQDNNTTAAVSADPASPAAARMSSGEVNPWIADSPVGIEGTVTATFGRFSPTVREQVVFYGGGLKVGKREGKYQPWAHILFGGAHDRFNQ